MYNSNSKQFVFKKSNNEIIALTHGGKNGICYSSLTKKNNWTMPISLEKQAQESFSACMDAKDIIHIIYQNSHGNIFYIHLDENSIVTLPMLGSKYPSLYNKYFNIITVKNNIHCFYVLLHNNKYLLTHQVISNKEVKNPQALGYINKNNLPYAVQASRAGDVYIFYQVPSAHNLQQQASAYQIGYKRYSFSDQHWDEFTPISSSVINPNAGLKIDYPNVIIDNTDFIHLTYQKLVADRYELIYRQKPIEETAWSTETVIHTSLNPFDNSSIICINEKTIIFWVRNDIIYYSYSADKGNSWSKPNKYSFTVGKQLSCISYFTNDFYEVNRVVMNEIPGSFVNGLKLAFYDDLFSTVTSSINKDGLRNIISENLKALNNTLNDLIEANNNIKTDIKRLKLFNTNILREIDKIFIKISYLENQIKQKRAEQSRIIETNFAKHKTIKNDILKDDFEDYDFKSDFKDYSTDAKKQEITDVNETYNENDTYDRANTYDEANRHDEDDTYDRTDIHNGANTNDVTNTYDDANAYDKVNIHDETNTNTNEES